MIVLHYNFLLHIIWKYINYKKYFAILKSRWIWNILILKGIFELLFKIKGDGFVIFRNSIKFENYILILVTALIITLIHICPIPI